MAFVTLSGGASGDLNTYVGINFGFDPDAVIVLDNFNYTIQTYESGDIISMSRVTLATATNTVYAGSGNDEIVGSLAVEIVHDGSGDDIANLLGGNDTAFAGSGNDVLDGGTGTDWISFRYVSRDALSSLALTNVQGVVVDLAKTTVQNFGAAFGSDKILNFENCATGDGGDTVLGTNGDNVLFGNGGADFLLGRLGNDSIFGGLGSDSLGGNGGADKIYCNGSTTTAADTSTDYIKYYSASESGLDFTTRDTIFLFDRNDVGQDDVIDFRAMDGDRTIMGLQPFTWRGSFGFTNNIQGEVRIVDLGTDVMVYLDNDADTAAEMSILVKNVGTMDQFDFIL